MFLCVEIKLMPQEKKMVQVYEINISKKFSLKKIQTLYFTLLY